MSFTVGTAVRIDKPGAEADGKVGTVVKEGIFQTVEDAEGTSLGTYHFSALSAASDTEGGDDAFEVGEDVLVDGKKAVVASSNSDGTYEVEDAEGRALGTFTENKLRAATAEVPVEVPVEPPSAVSKLKAAISNLISAITGTTPTEIKALDAVVDTPEEAAAEEAAELIQYTALGVLLAQASETLSQAASLCDEMVSDEEDDPTETAAAEDAEEEVEAARLAAMMTLINSTVGTLMNATSIIQSCQMDDYDDELDDADGEAVNVMPARYAEDGSVIPPTEEEEEAWRTAGGPGSGVRGHTTDHPSGKSGSQRLQEARDAIKAAGAGAYVDKTTKGHSVKPTDTDHLGKAGDATLRQKLASLADKVTTQPGTYKSERYHFHGTGVRNAVGARHSQTDQVLIQSVHDNCVKLGAACPEPEMSDADRAREQIAYARAASTLPVEDDPLEDVAETRLASVAEQIRANGMPPWLKDKIKKKKDGEKSGDSKDDAENDDDEDDSGKKKAFPGAAPPFGSKKRDAASGGAVDPKAAERLAAATSHIRESAASAE